MTCLSCKAVNSSKVRKCRKCKNNPRKAGRGNGAHGETSPMARATRTKGRASNGRLACRNNSAGRAHMPLSETKESL
jgi:hypothetical protein